MLRIAISILFFSQRFNSTFCVFCWCVLNQHCWYETLFLPELTFYTLNCYAQLVYIPMCKTSVCWTDDFIVLTNEFTFVWNPVEIGPVIWKFNQIDAFSFQRWWNFKFRNVRCVNLQENSHLANGPTQM